MIVGEKNNGQGMADLFLEFRGDRKRRYRGWGCKELACDSIDYAKVAGSPSDGDVGAHDPFDRRGGRGGAPSGRRCLPEACSKFEDSEAA